MNHHDIVNYVENAISANGEILADDIDVDSVASNINVTFRPESITDLDAILYEDFWKIVAKFDLTQH